MRLRSILSAVPRTLTFLRGLLGKENSIARRAEHWPGLEVPLDASEIEDFRPDKVGEPHLIYCSPKVRRTPDMDQEHKSTTLSVVECCPSLEPCAVCDVLNFSYRLPVAEGLLDKVGWTGVA